MECPLSERIEMGKRGREYLEKNHLYEKLAVKLERILLDVIGNGRFEGKNV